MLSPGIAEDLGKIISSMYSLQEQTIVLEDAPHALLIRLHLKSSAMMSFSFRHQREKDHVIEFSTIDFPIAVYHNAIARLTPIYNQLAFLEKHRHLASAEIFMEFAATASNIGLMLGEQSLIRTEEQIYDLIPEELRDEMVIVCGPIGENFIATVHFVRRLKESRPGDDESATLWTPFVPNAVFPFRGNEYRVIESVLMKAKLKFPGEIIGNLKAFQMLLSSIATNLSVEEDENEES